MDPESCGNARLSHLSRHLQQKEALSFWNEKSQRVGRVRPPLLAHAAHHPALDQMAEAAGLFGPVVSHAPPRD